MKHRNSLPNRPGSEQWLPRRDTTVLLLSVGTELQGAVGRVSAAAAVELIVEERLDAVAGPWDEVAAVLIDAVVAEKTGLDVGFAGWRGPTIIVGLAQDSALMWHSAERLGADRVAVLPDSAPWLANYLSCLKNPVTGAGVVGVVGGCGGAGASTLAVLVAAEAAERGTRTLLVDGDPWGGGLCAALSAEASPGLRWPELLMASGAINPEQLAMSLPQVAGLTLLSWGSGHNAGNAGTMDGSFSGLSRGGATPAPGEDATHTRTAIGEVMRSARGAFGLIVVDLGRTPEAFSSLALQCDGLVVVVPARARALAATRQMMTVLPPMPVGAVVRGALGEGLDATMVASAVGLPLVGRLPQLRGVSEALESQRLLELLRRRPVRVVVANILDWMVGDSPRSDTGTGLNGSKP